MSDNRIIPDGQGGFHLPDGGRIIPDTSGGFHLPDGGRLTPDGMGGYHSIPSGGIGDAAAEGLVGMLAPIAVVVGFASVPIFLTWFGFAAVVGVIYQGLGLYIPKDGNILLAHGAWLTAVFWIIVIVAYLSRRKRGK